MRHRKCDIEGLEAHSQERASDALQRYAQGRRSTAQIAKSWPTAVDVKVKLFIVLPKEQSFIFAVKKPFLMPVYARKAL